MEQRMWQWKKMGQRMDASQCEWGVVHPSHSCNCTRLRVRSSQHATIHVFSGCIVGLRLLRIVDRRKLALRPWSLLSTYSRAGTSIPNSIDPPELAPRPAAELKARVYLVLSNDSHTHASRPDAWRGPLAPWPGHMPSNHKYPHHTAHCAGADLNAQPAPNPRQIRVPAFSVPEA
jgi:hypothetical protein